MSIVDEYLQKLRDKLGLQSMAQIDATEQGDRNSGPSRPSAYLQQGKDVYLDPVQMEKLPEAPGASQLLTPSIAIPLHEQASGPVSPDWYKQTPPNPLQAYHEALMQAPQAAPHASVEIGEPQVDPQYAVEVGLPRRSPMTYQEAQDYMDFMGPQSPDNGDDYGNPAISAMRRRGR